MTVTFDKDGKQPPRSGINYTSLTIGSGTSRAIFANGEVFLPREGTADEWISDTGCVIKGTRHKVGEG